MPITLTDMFCGCGGSSQGAAAAGIEIKLAANHWELAVATHNTNFPHTEHVCADVSQANPRRWPHTVMLWASPECTNHSGAKGVAQWDGQDDMFDPHIPNEEAERSRATMWDVPRFAEYHNYRAIIVENVVDVRKWRLYDAWLHAMHLLDYEHRACYLNSQFFGAPQSRDRLYVVFWKKQLRAPDLEFHPRAQCDRCGTEVDSIQSWKRDRTYGKYQRQYVYCCPICANEVFPFYTPAASAIDWSNLGRQVGDRLKPKTRERIRAGLEKFNNQAIVIETAYSQAQNIRARLVTSPLMTQTTRQTIALTIPPSMIIVLRNRSTASFPTEPLSTITAGGINHGLLVLNYSPGYSVTTEEPMGTITTSDHHALVTMPWLLSYYGTGGECSVSDPMNTITTLDRHALVTGKGSVSVEDCFFRMLMPPEILRGMAFRSDYVVLGNSRQQVRQCGQAVTPVVATSLFERCAAVL